jgi:hypothetical protein
VDAERVGERLRRERSRIETLVAGGERLDALSRERPELPVLRHPRDHVDPAVRVDDSLRRDEAEA